MGEQGSRGVGSMAVWRVGKEGGGAAASGQAEGKHGKIMVI